ncbi:Type IV secretory pathway, VirB10 components [Pseudomonas peli]|uniref:Type IV secretory pathway, VirB10 components n=1 Tax=Pseudomonas peli TaxID=592361 RepID=A0A1G4U6D9_9PSED|nr:type IV secretion system protein VirB10 [Pseudomonas peli]NMZ71330.1 TrbI/VirB10 family protein [Pseudomonas peli]NMZ71386.1 TrbI/VirB10 family protein [Pseudomonas peli]SCW89210.1 Type IV secretory pathway, VirB10 components [Pseudomonas peli]
MRNNPYENFDEEETGKPLPTVEHPEPIYGDRGEPTTKAPKRKDKRIVIAVVAVIVFALLVVGFFGLFFYNAINKNKAAAEAQVKDDAALAMNSSTGPDLGAFQDRMAKQMEDDRKRREAEALARKQAEGKSQPAAPAAAQPPANAPGLGQYQAAGGQAPREMKNGKPVPTPAEIAAARRWQEDVLWTGEEKNSSNSSAANSGGAQQGRQAGASSRGQGQQMTFEERMAANPYMSAAMGGTGGGSLGGSSSSTGNSIGGMLATETYPDGIAMIRPDQKFLLIHGTTIPCTLITRIVTNYPGQTSCLINRDVYSSDGSVVLISRGSKVDGERKVSMENGIAKVFVSWGSIETPDGVRVRIDSMAADQLGAAGLDAWIDNHYAERFGGAILLSFLDDAFQAIADQASSGGDDAMTFDSSTDNAQDMASIALENSINIPPTGYVNHATETNIIVARDIDFRTVYGVE